MNTIELLTKAIKIQKPISFLYNKEGKIKGERIGNPHAVFPFITQGGIRSIKTHIVQIDGVSDSQPNNFPEFRTFDIEEISDIKILENENQFQIDENYNPDWENYADAIAKI